LSSIAIAATPAASKSATVRMTLIALPKPVSQSAITGIDVASTIARVASSISLIVKMLASGTARTAERPKPLAQIASKPACSTSFADSASCAPQATSWRRSRSRAFRDRDAVGIGCWSVMIRARDPQPPLARGPASLLAN
jgi:hypothetical protein